MFLSQKFAQPHFAAVKAACLLQYVSLTFAHVETKIFDHPYLQNTDTQAEAQSFKSNFWQQVLPQILNWIEVIMILI